jgi:sugar phosphate isomerase/epimerase
MKTRFDEMLGMTTMGATKDTILPMVRQIHDAGFRSVEIIAPIALAAREYPPSLRDELKAALRRFEWVSVHAQTALVERAEQLETPAERDALLQPHVDMMRFTHEVGGRVVTWHPFMPHKYEIMLAHRFDDQDAIAHHVEAGRYLLEHARRLGLTIGFEAFDTRIVDPIHDRRWGSLFDIGHASQNGARAPFEDLTEQALNMIGERLDRIVQFHLHGVSRSGDSFRAHQPLDENNLVDYGRIMSLLAERDFQGPLIFEILRKADEPMCFDETVASSVAARRRLMG